MKLKLRNKLIKYQSHFLGNMKYETWEKIYEDIANDLNLDKNQDEIASEIFDNLISQNLKTYVSLDTFFNLIQNRTVFVFGAAPSLESDIKNNIHQFQQSVLITADGATSALLKYDIVPDIIITDLDGVVSDQLRANKKKAILVIHAHGDNINIIQQTIPRINGSYLGTVQTNTSGYNYVKNFGGFTDGDRSVFFAAYFHAKKIILAGFDCKNKAGFYSFQKNKNQLVKQKKLQWCQHLLNRFPDTYLTHI